MASSSAALRRRSPSPEIAPARQRHAAPPSIVSSLAWSGVQARRLALWLIFAWGVFHLMYADLVPLSGDEAYYWQWARRLDWGYYDHPPMVAWLVAVGTVLSGHSEFGIRAPTVLLSIGILAMVYQLAAQTACRLAGPDVNPAAAGLWAVAALTFTPLFGLGGMIATPDVPVAFCWAASLLLAQRIVVDPRPRHWLLLGVWLGFGVLSKYTQVILPVALGIAFIVTRHGRQLLRTPGPYLAMATAFVICLPHLAWLTEHDFVSVLFQLDHGFNGGSRDWAQQLEGLPRFLARQAGVLNPLLFVFFIVALARGVGLMTRLSTLPEGKQLAAGLLVLPALLTLLVFAVASLFTNPQAQWPAPAYVTLAALLGPVLAEAVAATRGKCIAVVAGLTMAALLLFYAHVEAAYPMLPYQRSVFDKVQDKAGLAEWLEAQRTARGREAQTAPVLTDNYRQASLLAFYLKTRPCTDAPFERGSGEQYHLWRRVPPAEPGGHAWYLTRRVDDPWLNGLLDAPQAIGSYAEQRAGVVTRTLHLYYGRLRHEVALPCVAPR